MGHPTLVTQDCELGDLLTKTEYLPNFTTRLTNPRGHQTTTSYYAWDTPTQDYPNVIAHPEGATTSIERDAYGKTLSLLRTDTDGSWQRRYFRYNAQQEVCNRTELESVTTAFGYDAAGNLAWSAGGLPWHNGCPDPNDANLLSRRTTRTYDHSYRRDHPGPGEPVVPQRVHDRLYAGSVGTPRRWSAVMLSIRRRE